MNKLENDIPSKKRKITLDDRKEAIKKAKLDKNPATELPAEKKSYSSGEAEKKRKVYKDLLGFNSSSSVVETKNSKNFIQLNCSPPTSQPATLQPNQHAIVKVEFRIGEVVWAKIRGFPAWPAKIKAITSSKMVLVVWFNDYRVTKVYKTQLSKFLINFDSFAKNFENSIGLKTAAREALMYYGNAVSQS